jgi:hypothetical protein
MEEIMEKQMRYFKVKFSRVEYVKSENADQAKEKACERVAQVIPSDMLQYIEAITEAKYKNYL